MGMAHSEAITELETDLRESVLLPSHLATDAGGRIELDEMITAFGFDRAELVAKFRTELLTSRECFSAQSSHHEPCGCVSNAGWQAGIAGPECTPEPVLPHGVHAIPVQAELKTNWSGQQSGRKEPRQRHTSTQP